MHLRGVPPVLIDDVQATFDLLYGDLQGEVAGHIKRLMRGRTLDALSAEDCVQTVWLKVWSHLPTVQRRPGHGRHDGLRSWVHTIARNTVLDLANRAAFRKHVSLGLDGLIDFGAVNVSGNAVRSDPGFEAPPSTDPHECVVGRDVADALAEALEIMTAHERRCMIGMLSGENSIEIGQRLNRSDRGVRQAYFRGRRRFEAVAERRGVETCR